jgi:hypothetical protein
MNGEHKLNAIVRYCHILAREDQGMLEALFARGQAPHAGRGQAKLSEPPDRIAQADQALPVQLGNLALRFALADFEQ